MFLVLIFDYTKDSLAMAGTICEQKTIYLRSDGIFSRSERGFRADAFCPVF